MPQPKARPIIFGAHKRPVRITDTFETREDRARSMLARVLNLKTTVAIVGSGCSAGRKNTKGEDLPEWREFAEELLEVAGHHLGERNCLRANAQLERLKDELKTFKASGPKEPPAEMLMFIIGLCTRYLRMIDEADLGGSASARGSLLGTIMQRFEIEEIEDEEDYVTNPIEGLRQLGIRRFVTTNYDDLIEKTIQAANGGASPEGSSGDRYSDCSFTQEAKFVQKLSRFALAKVHRPKPEVFHCHGRWDRPSSIIASEEDYQRWYVQESNESSHAFRLTMQLVLESNPLLFVGYGLRDLDLLAPLRHLLATERDRLDSRPIFALMPLIDGQSQIPEMEMLHERYGLQIITYELDASDLKNGKPDPHQRPKKLCNALIELRASWTEARQEWARKPLPRAVEPDPEAGPEGERRGSNARGYLPLESDILEHRSAQSFADKIRKAIAKGARVISLIGPSGAGKSAALHQLVVDYDSGTEHLQHFHGCFYWNSHFENESLTARSRAEAFFNPHSNLFEDLRDHPRLVVLDGMERLLVQGKNSSHGRIFSEPLAFLIRFIAEQEKKHGTVFVLGSRMAIEGLPRDDDGKGVDVRHHDRYEEFRMRRKPHEDLGDEDEILSAVLDHHDYAVYLAQQYLDVAESPETSGRSLIARLAAKTPDRRRTALIKEVLKSLSGRNSSSWEVGSGQLNLYSELGEPRLDPECDACESFDDCPDCRSAGSCLRCKKCTSSGEPEFVKHLAERLSLFVGQIHPRTQQLLSQDLSRSCRFQANSAMNRLRSVGILFKIHGLRGQYDKNPGEAPSVIHPTVREALTEERSSIRKTAAPFYAPTGLTTRSGGMDPGSLERLTIYHETFDVLSRATQAAITLAEGDPSKRREAVILCRDLYTLVRSQSDAVGALRWMKEGERMTHVQRTITVAGLAKALAGPEASWTYEDPQAPEISEGASKRPLFLSELLWLYNDVALSLFFEGLMPDAYSVWEQAWEIAKKLEGEVAQGKATIEILLNLSYTFFEMGKIVAAQDYLDIAENKADQLRDKDADLLARITGFRGLFMHVRGNTRSAGDLYDRCLTQLFESREELGNAFNPRAMSFFLCYQSQLWFRRGRSEEAKENAASARALAEAHHYRELAVQANVALADALTGEGNAKEARQLLEDSAMEARVLGSAWLEASALQALSRTVLLQGDAEGARSAAIRALALANENRLGLIMTRSLESLGLSTVRCGSHDLGMTYLRLGKELADRQRYLLRARDLEEDLRRGGQVQQK